MNIIDFLLLLVIAVSVAFAVYRGSVASLLGLAACLVSLVIALYAGPLLASALGGNQGVTDLLTTYSDAGSQVGDYALATTQVNTMSEATLEAVIKSVHLPDSIERILHQNLAARVFTSAGMRTVNEYVTATIVSVLLEAGSFVIAFLLCCLALHMVINLIGRDTDGLNANFKLSSKGGENLILLNNKGKVIDALKTKAMGKNQSLVRNGRSWDYSAYSTPGYENSEKGLSAYRNKTDEEDYTIDL